MKKVISKQLEKLNKKEAKILNKKESKIYNEKISPVVEKIEGKIPEKLKSTLELAFYNGFKVVFEKGSKYIEKLYNKDKIKLEHDINNYSLEKRTTRKSIRAMDAQARKSKFVNTTISTIEGAGLGALGIGLPDIPVFIALILKSIYEIALGYGFDYERLEEKIYILNLISTALTTGEVQNRHNENLDRLALKIDLNMGINNVLDDEIKKTSEVLSESMLVAKFVQGLPLVGVVGSVTNYLVINKITKYATIKYKKRYLNKRL